MPGAALCLHGRVSSWSGTKSLTFADVNASRRSLVRLAADSYHRHIIAPNRGVWSGVYLHSWNPDLATLFAELYSPAASVHEPIKEGLRAVASQALSMRRCVALVPEDANVDRIMVARHDLLFYEDVPLRGILARGGRGDSVRAGIAAGIDEDVRHDNQAGSAPSGAMWLPHTCQHTTRGVKSEWEAMYDSCGCGKGSRHRASCEGMSGMGVFACSGSKPWTSTLLPQPPAGVRLFLCA